MKLKRTLIFFLVFVLALTANQWAYVSAESISEIEKEIKEWEQKEKELQKEQDSLGEEKSTTEDKIDENLSRQEQIRIEMDAIDKKLEETRNAIATKENEIQATNEEIEKLNNRIEELKEEIEQLEEEIEELKKSIEKREDLLKERLRNLQKNGGKMQYLEVILGSTSFSDFISRTAAVTVLMDQDQAIMDALVDDREAMEQKKKSVEKSKREVEDNREEVVAQKNTLESQKQELVALQGDLDNQIREKQNLITQLEEEQIYLEEYIFTLEEEQEMLEKQKQAASQARKIAEQKLQQLGSNSSGSTGFIWPATGTRSSNYGTRVDPITYKKSYHLGIDIAGPVGTPIYAAASGVAMPGNKSWTYGNHVMIASHINGVDYTHLYAHMSSYVISSGEYVEQGQLIGYMGSTGRSTGPHLHFEIHKGGWIGFYPPNSNVVNPMNYLP